MSQKWTRITVAALIIVVAVVSALLGIHVARQNAAAARAGSHHTSSFTAYVLANHIGTIVSTEGGLGLDANTKVLQIHHPMAPDQIRPFTLKMFEKFHTLDGGSSLSIVYKNLQSGINEPVGEAVYDPQSGVLNLILHHNGTTEESEATLSK